MKSFLTASVAAVALVATGALAADVNERGSIKDTDVFGGPIISTSRSGFYVTGALGIADADRSIRRDINRGVDANLDVTGEDPADVADAQADLAAIGIPSTLNGNNLNIPLVGDHLGLSDSNDFSSAVFGGGVSYLFQFSDRRLGLSLGLDATFYSDADSSTEHSGAVGTFTGGTALSGINTGGFSCVDISTCAGQPAQLFGVNLTQAGALSFDRDFDIDVPIKLHYFLSDRLAVNIGAGPSWARGNLKGGNAPTDAISTAINGALPGFSNGLTTGFNDDDTSLGYIVTAGVQFWATDRIVLGLQGDYKHHTFEFDAASSANIPVGGPFSLGSHAQDSVEVEDDVYSIKATASFKLN